jgi:hypothetical protein
MNRTTLTLATQRRLAATVVENLPDRVSEEDALYWLANKGKLKELLDRVLILSPTGWLDRLVQSEEDAHRAFFGETFDLAQFHNTLERYGEERVGQWAILGLQPHFLPKLILTQDSKFRGWKIKPEDWFWQQVAAGSIMRRNAADGLEIVKEVGFDGVTVLIDTRCKPAYDGGRQSFGPVPDLLLGTLIEALRNEGKIARYEYGEQSSRFGVSSREWDEHVRPALEALPVFKDVAFRLEMTIEANCIPQMYKRMPRKKDGQTNTWVWYEEFFGGESYRLYGGDSDYGGLAHVNYLDVGIHWNFRAVRPLGVLLP